MYKSKPMSQSKRRSMYEYSSVHFLDVKLHCDVIFFIRLGHGFKCRYAAKIVINSVKCVYVSGYTIYIMYGNKWNVSTRVRINITSLRSTSKGMQR